MLRGRKFTLKSYPSTNSFVKIVDFNGLKGQVLGGMNIMKKQASGLNERGRRPSLFLSPQIIFYQADCHRTHPLLIYLVPLNFLCRAAEGTWGAQAVEEFAAPPAIRMGTSHALRADVSLPISYVPPPRFGLRTRVLSETA